MARYRPVDMSPRLLPVVLEEQLVAGTFADVMHRLVDILDLSAFDARYHNDTAGAPAHAPGMLLKAVLLAYLRTLLIHGARSVLTAANTRRARGQPLDRFHAWALTVAERRGANKAAVALANKLARRLWAMTRDGTSFDGDHVSVAPAAH